MSLTSFLLNKDVRGRFSLEFPKPRIKLKGEILAPALSRRYSLVGTAFDYLLRFYLKRMYPRAIEHGWVAYHALGAVSTDKETVEETAIEVDEGGKFVVPPPRWVPKPGYEKVFHKIEDILAEAEVQHSRFLRSGQLSDDLVRSSIQLAQLDVIFRAGYIDDNLGRVYRKDVRDLRQLMAVVDPALFEAKRVCVLNPCFGMGSCLVGGADADIVIDETLIEVKATMHLRLHRSYFNQLVGYYVLSRIGAIDDFPSNRRLHRLGIYYARHGKLHVFPVETVIDEKRLPSFIRWFKSRAKQDGREITWEGRD